MRLSRTTMTDDMLRAVEKLRRDIIHIDPSMTTALEELELAIETAKMDAALALKRYWIATSNSPQQEPIVYFPLKATMEEPI